MTMLSGSNRVVYLDTERQRLLMEVASHSAFEHEISVRKDISRINLHQPKQDIIGFCRLSYKEQTPDYLLHAFSA